MSEAVLVTGGSGFLGRRVLRTLAAAGRKPVCFDCSPPREPRVPFVLGDILDKQAILDAITAHGIRRIIHLAAILPPETETDPQRAARVNVLGTRQVLEAAAALGVKRVVYSSSIAVYGPQSAFGDRAVTEEDIPCPVTCYGMAKAANEHAAALFRQTHGLDVRVLRLSSVFGHGRYKGVSGAIGGALISLPAVSSPVVLEAGPDEACSLIYVQDAAELCVRLATADSLTVHTYNSGGITASVREMADLVRSLIPDARIATGHTRIPHVHWADGSRIQADTGYKLPPLRDRVIDQIHEARREAEAASRSRAV